MKMEFRKGDCSVAKKRRFAWPPFVTAGALLLLQFFSAAAAAAEWVVAHTSPEGDRYSYDASKLAMSGNEITYWKKVTFKSAQPYKGSLAVNALYRERIHCAEHTLKSLSYVIHAASGAVIEQVATESEAAAVVPETIGDVFEQTLCPILKSKHEEPPLKPPPAPPLHTKAKEKTGVPPPPPAVKDKVESPAPPVKEKIEAPAPPIKEKIEAPAPPAKEKVEVPAPPPKEKVEVSAPPAKDKMEASVPPVKAMIEAPAPPEKAKEKIDAPVPPAFSDESGLL